MEEITPGDYRNAERDALAILAALVREDWDAVKVFTDAGDLNGVLTASFNLFFAVLAESGKDPAEWIAQRQAEWTAAEAAEGGT